MRQTVICYGQYKSNLSYWLIDLLFGHTEVARIIQNIFADGSDCSSTIYFGNIAANLLVQNKCLLYWQPVRNM